MARNEEKAQSMLYRFREAQAAELGMKTRQDRRPRMASSCTDIRQAERWRGEILHEISRKVSKIQDPGLNDYELRDLNDAINKLFREKSHWETQIINLGGANYRRAGVASTDALGKTIPGQRGYKYFGRAKELPGVKELFEGAAREAEEMDALAKTDEAYSMFKGKGPAYFGDLDEQDGAVLQAERQEEEAGWTEAYDTLASYLDISPAARCVPPVPQRTRIGADSSQPEATAMSVDDAAGNSTQKSGGEGAGSYRANLPNGYETILFADDLTPPVVPTASEMEQMIMRLQKAALLQEYVH